MTKLRFARRHIGKLQIARHEPCQVESCMIRILLSWKLQDRNIANLQDTDIPKVRVARSEPC